MQIVIRANNIKVLKDVLGDIENVAHDTAMPEVVRSALVVLRSWAALTPTPLDDLVVLTVEKIASSNVFDFFVKAVGFRILSKTVEIPEDAREELADRGINPEAFMQVVDRTTDLICELRSTQERAVQ